MTTTRQPLCAVSEPETSARSGALTSPTPEQVRAMIAAAHQARLEGLYRKPSGDPAMRKEIARRAGWGAHRRTA